MAFTSQDTGHSCSSAAHILGTHFTSELFRCVTLGFGLGELCRRGRVSGYEKAVNNQEIGRLCEVGGYVVILYRRMLLHLRTNVVLSK